MDRKVQRFSMQAAASPLPGITPAAICAGALDFWFIETAAALRVGKGLKIPCAGPTLSGVTHFTEPSRPNCTLRPKTPLGCLPRWQQPYRPARPTLTISPLNPTGVALPCLNSHWRYGRVSIWPTYFAGFARRRSFLKPQGFYGLTERTLAARNHHSINQ